MQLISNSCFIHFLYADSDEAKQNHILQPPINPRLFAKQSFPPTKRVHSENETLISEMTAKTALCLNKKYTFLL